jgi:hypothetical protein
MILDNLRTRLPHLFVSLMKFSNASSQAIEAINYHSSQQNAMILHHYKHVHFVVVWMV